MKLFSNKSCPYCQRAMIMVKEKGVALQVEEIPLGDAMPQWYKEVNPRETVPTLQVGEKKYVFESDLIARYLDSVSSPTNSLVGSTPYNRHRIEFFLSQVSDLIQAYFALVRDPFNAEKRKAVDDNSEFIEGIIAEHQGSGPYFLDDTFSLADIMVLPFLIRFRAVLGYYAAYDIFKKAPRLKKMYLAAMERPSVKESTLKPEEYIGFFKKYVPVSHVTHSMAPSNVLFVSMLCPFADRARLSCAIKKVDIPLVELDLRQMPVWYPWVNYLETVPTLLTSKGTYVYESQPIVHYIDDEFSQHGPALLPKDADELYFVRFVESNAGHFVGAMFGIMRNPQNKETKEELEWAAGELEKQLAEHRFGAGPFFGGATMNAADVCLLPMLVRLKACTPGLTDGYNLFAKFKLLEALLEAGMATEAGKKVFQPLTNYLQAYTAKFRSSS
ncbi:thiol transferase Tc52 [Trypanosoma grayi]|uniref:thiol transferase Tc52 n=1 Tax=Trypanosoma grayi TaxID=71804 RepID=UPI0004F458DE|nr:thiol transferase Tc52 [Trypanosoma grayi]KEG14728.1 thiol transferase Tc52 [Trypanosoma grayi]